MKKFFVLALMVLSLCVAAASFADTYDSDDTPALRNWGGMAVGGHDIFLPEAPALYNGGIMRMYGVWTRDDLSYLRYGFLAGVAEFGVGLGAGVGRTAVLHDLAEIGFRVGADLDAWLDASIVTVSHAKFQIKSLWSNPTSLYATVAGELPLLVPVKQTDIQPSRPYAFVGINQRVGPLDLDVAWGNRNTVRVGFAVNGITIPCTSGSIGLGSQLLRSPDQSSVAIFVTSSYEL